MTLEEFKKTLDNDDPPVELDKTLHALWFDGKGDWNKAHNIAQSITNSSGSWIHAYLHRKEGDLSNSSYWYSRAGKKMPDFTLQEEWNNLVSEFLNK
jgi:hypothetical protein